MCLLNLHVLLPRHGRHRIRGSRQHEQFGYRLFRGSSSLRNNFTDFDFPLVVSDLCTGCLVHDGFWDSWFEARAGVMKSIMAAAKDYPTYQLVVTGHSLGGAIATLAAAQLRTEGHTAALVILGPQSQSTALTNVQ